jgi:hypothetical protein
VLDAYINPEGTGKNSMTTASAAKTKSQNGDSKAPKLEVKKNQKPEQVNEILAIEKRIQKVEELTIVIEKWRKLTEARKNMKSFSLGNDGLSATIRLVDATGREFKTSHNQVVTTVIETVLNELDKSISLTEQQINFAA